MPTARNYHPGGYPAFTVFLLVVDRLKSGTDKCTKLLLPPRRDVWMGLNLFCGLLFFLPSVIFGLTDFNSAIFSL